MLRFLFLSFFVSQCTSYIVSDDILRNDNELFWPERYTLSALKMSLTADISEKIQAWVSNSSSRVDYNDGVVKEITKIFEDDDDNMQYEIHPVIYQDVDTELICDVTFGLYENIILRTMLPDVQSNSFDHLGSEPILDYETEKFQYIDESYTERTIHTVWAEKIISEGSEEVDYWIPVRYEILEYNTLGSETDHTNIFYSNFNTEFDDDVFDLKEYDCDSSNTQVHTMESEAVTKELKFIDTENHKHVEHVFNSFKKKFDRNYAHENEHAFRRSVFKKNMRLISSINRKNLTYKLGVTQFADRTPEEMRSKHTGLLKRPAGKTGNFPFPYTQEMLKSADSKLPEEYDARLHGLVGPVRNQGTCGSCWTYGSTAAVEGALARVNGGRLLSLSNQVLVDCAWDLAHGCGGGSDIAAFEWMMNHGLPTEEEYGPYMGKDGYCKVSNMTKLYAIRGYTDVTPFSTSALKIAAINHGPLSVSVEVTTQFKLYSRGIYYESGCGPNGLNHEVSLVGYGVEDGELFWLLKNSWGTSWGIAGFMKISARNNNCGVATEPTYAVI